MKKLKKLLIIDGSHMIWRSYSRSTKIDYKIINKRDKTDFALPYMFINLLIDTLLIEKPDFVVFVMDTKTKNFRHELYPKYKVNRKETPPEILDSIPTIKQLLIKLGIKIESINHIEGDDIIATYVKMAQKQNFYVKIISGDKDLYQLLDRHIHVYNPTGKNNKPEIMNPRKFKIENGFSHKKLTLYKTIKGDNSDNIGGVPFITSRTVVKLVNSYDNIDDMLNTTLYDHGNSVSKSLKNNLDKIHLNAKLVKLKTDINVENKLNTLEFHAKTKTFAHYMNHIGFRKILIKIKKLEDIT